MDDGEKLDDLDRHIIRLLLGNGRRTFSDIGAEVNLSASAVQRRVARLERTRVITGYRAIVDNRTMGRSLEAFAALRLTDGMSPKDVQSNIGELPDVVAVFVTAGDPNMLVWFRVEDIAGLRKALETIRRGGSIASSRTMVVLESWWRGSEITLTDW